MLLLRPFVSFRRIARPPFFPRWEMAACTKILIWFLGGRNVWNVKYKMQMWTPDLQRMFIEQVCWSPHVPMTARLDQDHCWFIAPLLRQLIHRQSLCSIVLVKIKCCWQNLEDCGSIDSENWRMSSPSTFLSRWIKEFRDCPQERLFCVHWFCI